MSVLKTNIGDTFVGNGFLRKFIGHCCKCLDEDGNILFIQRVKESDFDYIFARINGPTIHFRNHCLYDDYAYGIADWRFARGTYEKSQFEESHRASSRLYKVFRIIEQISDEDAKAYIAEMYEKSKEGFQPVFYNKKLSLDEIYSKIF